MLIAVRDFDVKSLIPIMSDPDKVVSVVEASVPSYLRHRKEIVMNQRFYVANLIRGAGTIPINIKLAVCEALVSGISITGTTEIYTTISDVAGYIDKQLLLELFEEEENDTNRNVPSRRGVHSPQNVSV